LFAPIFENTAAHFVRTADEMKCVDFGASDLVYEYDLKSLTAGERCRL
jgi:hypothetical protein